MSNPYENFLHNQCALSILMLTSKIFEDREESHYSILHIWHENVLLLVFYIIFEDHKILSICVCMDICSIWENFCLILAPPHWLYLVYVDNNISIYSLFLFSLYGGAECWDGCYMSRRLKCITRFMLHAKVKVFHIIGQLEYMSIRLRDNDI